jgi:hypothetical protein
MVRRTITYTGSTLAVIAVAAPADAMASAVR